MHHAAPASPIQSSFVPDMVPVPKAPAMFGIPRSTLYRLAAQGHVRFVKLGRSTLVDTASVRAFLATLPTARIGANRTAA